MAARQKIRRLSHALTWRRALLKDDAADLSLEPSQLTTIFYDGEVSLLSELQTQLEILEELRQAIEKEVQAVNQHSLRATRCRERNSALPVSRLPLETLAVIFESCLLQSEDRVPETESQFDVDVAKFDRMRRRRFFLMATCSWWRKAVIGNSALWTQIVLYESNSIAARYPRPSGPRLDPNPRSIIDKQIQRSHTRPLSLWVRWRREGPDRWAELWNEMLLYLPRFIHIHLDLGRCLSFPISMLENLPQLQSLSYIQPLYPDGYKAQLNNAPCLRTLRVEGLRGTLHGSRRAELSISDDIALNLTSLSIIGMFSGSTAMLCCIQLCQNLVALQWESPYTNIVGGGWNAGEGYADWFPYEEVSLPKLKYLWLGEYYAIEYLSWLNCPKLEVLVLRDCDLSVTDFTREGVSWDVQLPNLARIYADLKDYDSEEFVSSEFPQSHPAVEEVYLLTEVLDAGIADWFAASHDVGGPKWPSLKVLALDADFLGDVDYAAADALIVARASMGSAEKPFVLRVVGEPDDFGPDDLENIPLVNRYSPQHLQFTPLGDPISEWYQLWREIVRDI